MSYLFVSGARLRKPGLTALVLICAACTATPTPWSDISAGAAPRHGPRFGAPPMVRGLALGLYPYPPAVGYKALLREIVAQGASHVSLVVHWTQDTVRSEEIRRRRLDTAPDSMLRRSIRYAKKLGLRVLLFPILQVRKRAKGEWRGTLQPKSWARWFESYRAFMLHYAKIGAELGVDLLSIGSELVSTERRRDDWRRTIEAVRKVFRGKLVYSANWDHFQPIAFWDLVDYVGINGYYEIAKKGGSSLASMRSEWKRIRKILERFAGRIGKPLLITEVGYPSIKGGARWPWHYTRRAPVDLGEQARAYRAFIETWQNRKGLTGVFFWQWGAPGGPRDGKYTPREKPAARLLRSWFRGG